MNTGLEKLKSLTNRVLQNKKLRNRIILAAVVLVVLQMYFVQELIAAELLFAIAFVVLSLLAGLFYVLGTIGERSFDATEIVVRAVAISARRGYVALEEVGKKQFRHPRSESAR